MKTRWKGEIVKDVVMEGGGNLKKGTIVNVWAEVDDALGISWTDRDGNHSMAIATSKVRRVTDEPGSDHGTFSPGNDAGIDPTYTDEQLVRDALLLLRKFASEPSRWPDGPKAFPGTVDQAEEALDRILDEARRTRFQADNMIVVPEDRALRAEAERDQLKMALAQACTNLAVLQPDHSREDTTVGFQADLWRDALLSGWSGPLGFDPGRRGGHQ